MRILHIITSLDPQFGGTSEAVRVMLRYAPEDCPSEVVTVDRPDAPFLRTIEAPLHALGPARSAYAYSPRLVPWLRANVSRFDGVILHGLWQHVSLATLRAVAGHLPYFVFPHGMLDPYFRRAFPLKHLKKLPVWFAVDYWVLRRAARVLFTSEAEASLATESFALHRWTPTVVPFGSIPPEGDAAAQRESFLTRYPALRGRRILLFLGRIHPKKGCDLLVDAFARVAAKDPALDLVLAGPDPQNWRPALEQSLRAAGLAHRVHFPGMLTGDAKWGAFYAAEAFILPSHQENFGIAVSEALSCGTPVLLSDKVNIAPEIAQDGAGYMEPDTAEGTLRLLTRWLDTPQVEREALSACALDTFARRYDMREGAKTIPRLFEAVISNQPRHRP